jgi:hypothetical protein
VQQRAKGCARSPVAVKHADGSTIGTGAGGGRLAGKGFIGQEHSTNLAKPLPAQRERPLGAKGDRSEQDSIGSESLQLLGANLRFGHEDSRCVL